MRLATISDDSEKRTTIPVGRYLLHRQIARGGMATIHIARLMGDEGFSRIVAAKRLLPEFAEDSEFVSMFMDEARIASKVHHPNVVPVLDLVTTAEEVMLVQEYVHGVPLHVLLRTSHEAHKRIPIRIAVSIAAQVLAGLHAAHTTVDEIGEPLGIVHRDVSPQNVMIALDGSARLLDFGVAKATMAAHVTRDGTFKGKLAYSAPEQVRGKPVAQSDVYSLAVVLWELLVGHRMHVATQGEAELIATIMNGTIPSLTEALSNEADWGAIDPEEWKVLAAIEPIIEKGLALDLDKRYESAADMEEELTKTVPPASASEVAAWVKSVGKAFIEGRDKIIAAEEASWRRTHANVSTIGGRRLTQPPVELARASSANLARASSANLARASSADVIRDQLFQDDLSIPVAPLAAPTRDARMIIGVLGALVVLLGVGVVFAMQSGSKDAPQQRETKEAVTLPTPPTFPPPEPTKAPAVTVTPLPAPAPAEPATKRDEEPAEVETKATREAPPIRRPVAKPAPRPTPSKIEKKKEESAPPPTKQSIPEAKPAAADTPKTDCNPPYYFEGQKKVFKPQCL